MPVVLGSQGLPVQVNGLWTAPDAETTVDLEIMDAAKVTSQTLHGLAKQQ